MPAPIHLLGVLVSVGLVGCATPYGEESSGSDRAEVVSDSSATVAKAPGVRPSDGKSVPSASSVAAPPTVASATQPVASSPGVTKPSSIALSWNRVSASAEYSLDVSLENGDRIAPCEAVEVIGQSLTFEFNGLCVSPNIRVAIADIRDFRMCSAENGDWDHALCVDAHWDGASPSVQIHN